MSQAVDAYRAAFDQEIMKWSGYERVLRGENKQMFDELMNMARSYVHEGSSADKTSFFQPMAMSIILAQNMRIKRIEEALNRIKPPQETLKEEEKPVEPAAHQPKPKPTPLKTAQRGLSEFG